MKKVILITGASRGLGKAMYDFLNYKTDHIIYGTSRNPQANGVEAGYLRLDLTDWNSMTALVQEVLEREGRIDVLINNVGNNHIGSAEGTTMGELELQMNTSFYGPVGLMKLVLPIMRQQNSGQIINISSMGGLVPLPYNSAYAASKAALEAYTEGMTFELRGKNIHLSLIEPIGIKIDEEGTTLKKIDKELEVYKKGTDGMVAAMNQLGFPSVTKAQVAMKVLEVINARQPKLRYRVGPMSGLILLARKVLPRKLFEKIVLGQFK